jgi:hypothetical protein
MNLIPPARTHQFMKTRPLACSLFLLGFVTSASADTFTLKDGTTLEGKVLREEGDSYVVEVMVTKSIRDERVIPKSDVAKITKEQPDLAAFEKIASLVPAPDLLSPDDYDQRIREVEKFLKDHVGSSKSKAAREIIATLKSEANEILAGGKKVDGKIIPPSEYRANLYDIDSRIMEGRIRALVKDSQFLQALRLFSEMEREFKNTNAFIGIIPLIEQVIQHHATTTEQTLATFDARVRERVVGLDRMAQTDRRITENAIREENDRFEAIFKTEKDSKVGWVTPRPFFKPSLEETLTFAKQEQSRLASLKSAPPVDAGKIYRETLSIILSKGESTAVNTALGNARAAGISPTYMAKLESAARASGLIN